jgi:hypothetical protein
MCLVAEACSVRLAIEGDDLFQKANRSLYAATNFNRTVRGSHEADALKKEL